MAQQGGVSLASRLTGVKPERAPSTFYEKHHLQDMFRVSPGIVA